jgi:hypothetical protein
MNSLPIGVKIPQSSAIFLAVLISGKEILSHKKNMAKIHKMIEEDRDVNTHCLQ